MPENVFTLAALSMLSFIVWQTSKVQIARYVLAGLCGACFTMTAIAIGNLFPEKPHTCECIEVSGCDCVKGFCKCGINGKTCEACYEHAKRQGRVK